MEISKQIKMTEQKTKEKNFKQKATKAGKGCWPHDRSTQSREAFSHAADISPNDAPVSCFGIVSYEKSIRI